MYGIYSHTSQQFLLSDFAAIIYGFTTVPIYDTLGEEATEFIFEQTKLSVLFLTLKHLQKMKEITKVKKGLQYLKCFIVMDRE